jgi:hypothetical protein
MFLMTFAVNISRHREQRLLNVLDHCLQDSHLCVSSRPLTYLGYSKQKKAINQAPVIHYYESNCSRKPKCLTLVK